MYTVYRIQHRRDVRPQLSPAPRSGCGAVNLLPERRAPAFEPGHRSAADGGDPMSIPDSLAQFLDPRIPYATEVEMEAAGSRGTRPSPRPCDAFVKPVMMSVDGRIVMAVVPLGESIDIERLQKCLGTPDV